MEQILFAITILVGFLLSGWFAGFCISMIVTRYNVGPFESPRMMLLAIFMTITMAVGLSLGVVCYHWQATEQSTPPTHPTN